MAKNPKLYTVCGEYRPLSDGNTSNVYNEAGNSPTIPKGAIITDFVVVIDYSFIVATGSSNIIWYYGPKGNTSGPAQLEASHQYSTTDYQSYPIRTVIHDEGVDKTLGHSIKHKLTEDCIIKFKMSGTAVILKGAMSFFVTYYLK